MNTGNADFFLAIGQFRYTHFLLQVAYQIERFGTLFGKSGIAVVFYGPFLIYEKFRSWFANPAMFALIYYF